MTAISISLSSIRIQEVNYKAKQHVAWGRTCVGFALSMVGHLVDFMGSHIVDLVTVRLERDLVRMRGIISLVPDIEPTRVLDPNNEIATVLGDLQHSIDELHSATLRARDDIKLRRTGAAFRVCAQLTAALCDAVSELKKIIAEHDAKAAMSDDVRRLSADIKRTDDIPAGRYAELASIMRRIPERPAEDKSRDPMPF